MPSPIGHSLAGCAIYVGTVKDNNNNWKLLFLYILIANLPDFDFIPGFILGTPNRFHHGISHSIGFACIIGTALSLIVSTKASKRFYLTNVLIVAGLYFSHIFLDFFSMDTLPPFGEKLLWPINGEYYISSFKLFFDIRRDISSNSEFILTLFNFHNVFAMTLEICVLLPIVGLIYFLRKKTLHANKF